MKKGFTRLELLIIVSAIAIFALMAIPKLSDVKESRVAAQVQKDLVDIRTALEIHYKQTGEYPVLVGNEDRLMKVIVEDELTFGDIIGKRKMPSTPKVGEIESSNRIIDTRKFPSSSGNGGWNYDQSGRTGEIHVNLPMNIFKQEIDWNKE